VINDSFTNFNCSICLLINRKVVTRQKDLVPTAQHFFSLAPCKFLKMQSVAAVGKPDWAAIVRSYDGFTDKPLRHFLIGTQQSIADQLMFWTKRVVCSSTKTAAMWKVEMCFLHTRRRAVLSLWNAVRLELWKRVDLRSQRTTPLAILNRGMIDGAAAKKLAWWSVCSSVV